MFKVGLTGSIAMGKSTTAKMFADLGCAVFDSDAAVHALYSKDGAAVSVVADMFPDAVVDDQVDRKRLSSIVLKNPEALARLEAAVHPLVRQCQKDFIDRAGQRGHKFVVLDIPLLFETGQHKSVDAIVVVSTTADVQRTRALERPDMTEKKFNEILSHQLPDADKRAAADFIVDTGHGFDAAFDQVRKIVEELTAKTLSMTGA